MTERLPPATTERPPLASSITVLALAVVGLGLLATMPRMAPSMALVGVASLLLASAAVVAAGRTPLHAAVASVCFVLAAAATAAAVAAAALPLASSPTGTVSPDIVSQMILAGVVVLAAGVGATGALAVPRAGSFARGGPPLLRTATASCVALVAGILVVRSDTPGGAVDEFLGLLPGALQLLDPASSPELGGFLLLAGAGSLALAAAIVRVPLVPLAPRERRERLASRSLGTASVLHTGGAFAAAAGLALFVGELALGVDVVGLLPGGIASVVTDVANEFVRRLLLEVAVVSAVAAGLAEWIHRTDVDDAAGLLDLVADAVGGATLAAVLAFTTDDLFQRATEQLGQEEVLALRLVVSSVGAETLFLGAALAVCGGVAAVLWLAGVLAKVGALPGRRAAAVLAASGLALAAVGGGHLYQPSVQLFLVVGLAVVCWDVATFGQVLRREIGVGPATGRVELVHTGGVLSVGLVAAVGVFWARGETASLVGGSPIAGLVALAGVLLVAVGLYR